MGWDGPILETLHQPSTIPCCLISRFSSISMTHESHSDTLFYEFVVSILQESLPSIALWIYFLLYFPWYKSTCLESSKINLVVNSISWYIYDVSPLCVCSTYIISLNYFWSKFIFRSEASYMSTMMMMVDGCSKIQIIYSLKSSVLSRIISNLHLIATDTIKHILAINLNSDLFIVHLIKTFQLIIICSY